MENETIPNCCKLEAGSFLQNKANLLEAGRWQLKAFLLNEPNSTSLNPGIPASVYSYFSPNEPNFTLFLVLLPFPLYLFPFLLNEPNFAVNLSKTAISAKKCQKYIDL
jgi:hypothetical protein